MLETVSAAAMIGYFWAKFEIKERVGPLAETGIKYKQTLRLANKKSIEI